VRRDLLSTRIGTPLRVRIIELDSVSNRLIFSERAAQVQPGQRATILSTLQANTTLEGTITNLCDFGAFVDLGGVEGLIHISELSWGRVAHPRDILSTGQTLPVYILSVDAEEERIALSVKRLQPDPWQSVEDRYEIGQIVEGTVTNVVDFGAFACIEEGLEGLIHISELAEGQFLHPRAVVQEGARVKARILNIDGSNRRLGLSLRGLNGNGAPADF
jgi:small subunit ribosomal protein S1